MCLQSLAGHQSPVECVAFDNGEEAIVAGATGGTIKLWDLEQAKGCSPAGLTHVQMRWHRMIFVDISQALPGDLPCQCTHGMLYGCSHQDFDGAQVHLFKHRLPSFW